MVSKRLENTLRSQTRGLLSTEQFDAVLAEHERDNLTATVITFCVLPGFFIKYGPPASNSWAIVWWCVFIPVCIWAVYLIHRKPKVSGDADAANDQTT